MSLEILALILMTRINQFLSFALIIAEEQWQALERDLRAILDERVPNLEKD